jgi:hypothetical protein
MIVRNRQSRRRAVTELRLNRGGWFNNLRATPRRIVPLRWDKPSFLPWPGRRRP